jgi:nicotinamidase/pyrazinamidase
MPIKPDSRAALVVVDVQCSFLPGGSLAVPNGEEVIAPINRIGRAFANVVLTQDWHPPGHVSFASSHPHKQPLDTIALDYGRQTLWPEHCVQGTPGAALHADLDLPHAQLIIRKGFNPQIDSYSAFIEADGITKTGLDGYLRARGIEAVYLAGLATDFCVAWTALDARKLGFAAHVFADACRAIDVGGSLAQAWKDMADAGVERISAPC